MTSSKNTSPPTLTPQGKVTPLAKLLSCCLPKQNRPREVQTKDRGVATGEDKENVATTTVEESKTLDSDIVDPPNMDEEEKKSRDVVKKDEQPRVTPNAVFQFWQFLFSIIFLQFLHSNSNKRPKQITNEPATTTTKSETLTAA